MVEVNWYKDTLHLTTRGKGLHPFTEVVTARLRKWGVREGMCFLYMPHTSASLVIQENYDPTAQQDMEAFMEHTIPEGQGWYRHRLEGEDDSPAHLRAMITPVSLAIPVDAGELSLGTWQGIYLFEHRAGRQERQVLLRCLSVD